MGKMKTYYRIVTMFGNDGSVLYATSEEKLNEKPESGSCLNSQYSVYSDWFERAAERDGFARDAIAEGGKQVPIETLACLYYR